MRATRHRKGNSSSPSAKFRDRFPEHDLVLASWELALQKFEIEEPPVPAVLATAPLAVE
jgi:hypothetical protein